MKKVFLDTNILVDLLSDRKPYSKYAVEIFQFAELGQIQLYTSSHSIATTHYLLKKYLSEKTLREALTNLLDLVTIIRVDSDIIKKSLRSKHKDFEDSIQMYCAGSVSEMDYIVTRNTKDFKESPVPCVSPDEFVRIP